MTRVALNTTCSLVALLATSALAEDLRTGTAAFGDWQTDAPGATRKITVDALPAPLATPSARNVSKVIPQPENATLKTMPGFSVAPFVTGMTGARVIRIAPNGDIFLARSRPGGKTTGIPA